MRYKTIIVSVLSAILINAGYLSAQHLPKFSLFEENKNIVNPAAIIKQDTKVRLYYKNQWTGFNNAPVNAGLNITNDFGGFSAGLIYLNDRAGIFDQNMIKVQYAYKLRLSNKIFINFGLGAGINLYQIRYNDLNLYHSDDPIIYTQSENSTLPDFDLGLMITNMIPVKSYGRSSVPDKAFWGGISVQHLTSVIVTNDILRDNSYLLRHFNLMGGFLHPLNSEIRLEESLLMKYVNKVPLQAEFGIRAFYKNDFWAGLSYRSANDIILKLGVEYQGIGFAYAWDFAISGIPNHSSHEILLSYTFGQKRSVPKY